jgi:hypothetical protein
MIHLNALKLLLLTLLVSLFAAASPAQTLTNGSFELPGIPLGSSLDLPQSDTRLVGWTIGGIGGHVSLVNGINSNVGIDFPAIDGTSQLSFNGGNLVSGTFISQKVSTITGEVYEVSFYVGRLGNGGGGQSLVASAISDSGAVLTNLVAVPPSHGYGSKQVFTFMAASTNTTIKFLDTSTSTVSVDTVLDAVSMTRLTGVVSIEVAYLAICWYTKTNTYYQLQFKSEATTNLWTAFGQPVLGTGGRTCLMDRPKGQPKRFYRVMTLP